MGNIQAKLMNDFEVCALRAASRLADMFLPVTDRQRAMQADLYGAIASGDLGLVVETMRAARNTAPGNGVATPMWARLAVIWTELVEANETAGKNEPVL
jgi:hypothetical protein